MKSYPSAILLAFFLGGFGVHKFYLGRIGEGFLYFLFCWTFLPALLGFVDGIILISMGKEKFETIYHTPGGAKKLKGLRV